MEDRKVLKLNDLWDLVEKSNDLQDLLCCKRNKLRVDLHFVERGKDKLLKHIVAERYMELLRTFRGEKMMGMPVYEVDLIQTGDPYCFQAYFDYVGTRYYLDVKVINY